MAGTVERSDACQQLQGECSDGFDLSIKLASGFLSAQCLEEIRQLYAAAHRLIGVLVAEWPELPNNGRRDSAETLNLHGFQHLACHLQK